MSLAAIQCRPASGLDSTLQDSVERVLRATGVIVPTPDSTSGETHVVVNNVTDRAAAAAKGFGTGLTFGLIGNTIPDYYEMEVTITANGKTFHKSGPPRDVSFGVERFVPFMKGKRANLESAGMSGSACALTSYISPQKHFPALELSWRACQ